MIEIPMRTKGAWDQSTLLSINTLKTGQVYSAQNIAALQSGQPAGNGSSQDGKQISGSRRESTMGDTGSIPPRAARALHAQQGPKLLQMQIPPLLHPIQKGQKILLSASGSIRQADICLGWNSTNAQCDVDVSAFLLGDNGKVIGDDWFVFYGQTKSPDGSTVFEMDGTTDREVVQIDFAKLNPSIKKIVFVLTINEAFEKKLNFGMLKDAYIRILNHADGKELASFQMTDYYTNVISMMIGELYLHNQNWKFHGIGNGVAKDLAGLCGLYGVQVS